jgi:hypothetical protein
LRQGVCCRLFQINGVRAWPAFCSGGATRPATPKKFPSPAQSSRRRRLAPRLPAAKLAVYQNGVRKSGFAYQIGELAADLNFMGSQYLFGGQSD